MTNDPEVLDAINGYHIPFISKPYQTIEPRQIPLSDSEEKQMQECVAHLIDICAISEVTDVDGQFISSVFVVPKPDGSGRFILNLKQLNQFVQYDKFKLEDYRIAMSLIREGDFLAKIDLKDAYYLIPVAEEHRKYLRFRYRSKLYEFSCLPMGLSSAPRIYTKIMRPVVAELRKQGIFSVNYLDDFLIVGRSLRSCINYVQKVLDLLLELGFHINYKKSVLCPGTRVEFLGFEFDSVKMTIELPVRKKSKILNMIQSTLTRTRIKVKSAFELIGTLIAATPAVKFSMLHTRFLERDKISCLEGQNDMSKDLILSGEARSELIWWQSSIPTATNSISYSKHDIVVSSDASLSGWGGECNGVSTHGFWTVEERTSHINVLELWGAFYVIKSLAGDARSKHILLKTDNTTALAYINNQGGCRSHECLTVAYKIWEWCESNDNWITATYLNTKDNVIADFESRRVVDENDYMLDISTYNAIVQRFGLPSIDLFASYVTAKCPRYFSWFPDPNALAVDAFCQDWSQEFIYAFPPFSLIYKVLSKIEQDKAQGILIVPDWKTQAWFPLFKRLCCGQIMKIKKSKFTLICPFSGRNHPLSSSLNLLAARVAGNR